MKIKHLLIGLLAMSAVVACKQDDPVEEPKLEVSTETVALEATSAEATFSVTSNKDWTATADADWVTLDPASGAGAAEAVTVKVTAEDNEATEARTATVTVKAGELTKTVALTQAGTEPAPEPELPTPNVDWTSDAVVSYDLPEGASSKRQLLKNIKYTFDENYFYVKLQASAAEFAAAPAEYLGIFVYDVTDGSGDGYYGWWNDAKGNVELEGEHIGTFNGKDITLTIGETPVEVVTEENGDELVWTMNILRSAHENLALENPYFAFLTYIGWEPNGALPDKYENMLQFTPAAEPEPEPVDVDIDGKQWVFIWEALGVPAVFDFGVTEPGMFYFAYDMSAFGEEYAGIWYPFYSGTYSVEKTDGASGVVKVTLVDPYEGTELSADLPYTATAADAVTFDTSSLKTQLEVESVSATVSAELIDLTAGMGGEEEYLADGDYWIVSADKVATPIASEGSLKTVNTVDGKSTASNAFNFRLIDEAEVLYVISDSKGMYLYLNESGNFAVAEKADYSDDAYCWQVFAMGDGTYYIANYNTMGTIQLNASGEYVCVEDMVGSYPELIPVVDPLPEPEPEPTVSTIASVLALGNGATIPADTFVEGFVISNMDLNNLTSKKGMYIQDETAGLQFYLAANHTFKFGDKVKVDLSGAKVGEYGGAVQISNLDLAKIEVLSSGNAVEPKTVTIADFLANKYEGQYVAVENVQVAKSDLSKTWVSGGAHTSINIEDADGNKFVVFSSKYATYGTSTVSQGAGTLKGIASINNGKIQLIFAQNSDYAGLTGERFGEETVEPEPDQPETPVAANRADFETLTRSSKYTTYTTTAGWVLTNCAVQEGHTSDSNPQFMIIGKVPGTEDWAKAACMNGHTGAVGSIESPELAGGCGVLEFDFAHLFSDKNGMDFNIEVIQNGTVEKTINVKRTAEESGKMTKLHFSEEVNVSGTFKLRFINLCPTQKAGNADRVSLWNMTWTSFE